MLLTAQYLFYFSRRLLYYLYCTYIIPDAVTSRWMKVHLKTRKMFVSTKNLLLLGFVDIAASKRSGAHLLWAARCFGNHSEQVVISRFWSAHVFALLLLSFLKPQIKQLRNGSGFLFLLCSWFNIHKFWQKFITIIIFIINYLPVGAKRRK